MGGVAEGSSVALLLCVAGVIGIENDVEVVIVVVGIEAAGVEVMGGD